MTASTTAETGTGPTGHGPHLVPVTVNSQPVNLPEREMTGLEIKQAAIGQHVAIQPNFQLSVKHGQQYQVVGDNDTVEVHSHHEFLAVAPDDNS
jgi:hypothetical protein